MQTASRLQILTLALLCTIASLPAAEQSPSDTKSPVRHVNATQAQQLISDHKVIILDIRTPGEFKTGHLAGATNIDFRAPDFEKTLNSLSKTNSYLVHCAVGARSTQSLKIFERNHFQSIYHLDGGLKAWENAGLPIGK